MVTGRGIESAARISCVVGVETRSDGRKLRGYAWVSKNSGSHRWHFRQESSVSVGDVTKSESVPA